MPLALDDYMMCKKILPTRTDAILKHAMYYFQQRYICVGEKIEQINYDANQKDIAHSVMSTCSISTIVFLLENIGKYYLLFNFKTQSLEELLT